jgi:hypothetical protein
MLYFFLHWWYLLYILLEDSWCAFRILQLSCCSAFVLLFLFVQQLAVISPSGLGCLKFWNLETYYVFLFWTLIASCTCQGCLCFLFFWSWSAHDVLHLISELQVSSHVETMVTDALLSFFTLVFLKLPVSSKVFDVTM